jgi:type I restriction enzyme S subunit
MLAEPTRWSVQRLRDVAEVRVSNVDKHEKEGELPVRLCNYVDVYKNDRITERIDFMRATATPDEIERFRIRRGDVLMTKDSETWTDIGVPALVEYEAADLVSGYHLVLLRPRNGHLIGGFLLRALQSPGVAHQLHVAATGVTRYGLTHAAIKSVVLPVPPLRDQADIIRFLDHADRRIRRAILGKQKLIALLNEQKQAVIHRAVTRGLDPSVRLKPSGVDWLGEVPAHWEVLPLKRAVATRITDGPHETPDFLAAGIDFLSAEAMVDGRLDFERRRGYVSREAHEAYCRKLRPQRDDIFMCKSGATTGKVAIVETDAAFSVWSPLALVRVDPQRALPRFAYAVLQAQYVQRQVQDTWSYGTQPNLSMAAMERLMVALPPVAEQADVLVVLERQLRNLRQAVVSAQQGIDRLREYRTRLIADVVTGNLDVREAAARLPDKVDESESLDQMDVEHADESEVEDLTPVEA